MKVPIPKLMHTVYLVNGHVKRTMMIMAGPLILALVLSSVALAGQATQVITFHPTIPKGTPLKGSCWVGSIATDRVGAWRCKANNGIYDPCFSASGDPSLVVCQDDPFAKKAVALKLTEPLPRAEETRCKDCVWALELADGSICTVAGTGTLLMIADQPMRWGCTDSPCSGRRCPVVGVVGDLKLGRTWMADKVWARQTDDSFHVLKREFVPVRKIWR